MFKHLGLSLCLYFLLTSTNSFAQETSIKLLEPIELSEAGNAELHYMSAADFNGDKLTDLVVGNFEGKISIKINAGTKAAPLFNSKINLQSDSKDILVTHW